MVWNWQLSDWPRFAWDASRLAKAEERFLLRGGMLLGTVTHLGADDRDLLLVEAMCDEAVTTSQIEGEILNRDSVQSSIRRQLGLQSDRRKILPAEQGIGEVMVDLYRRFDKPLREDDLLNWHRMICQGRTDLRDLGKYRTHPEPMQIVSGPNYKPKVHFEAPPSKRVPAEMKAFIRWFNQTAPGSKQALPAITRAGIAHLYFECVHPFEDGNGRIGRAISEKALAQGIGQPSLTALATAVLARRGAYYDALEEANRRMNITNWLAWFAGICLEAQERSYAQVGFIIDKAKLLERHQGDLSARQHKVLLRVLREGPSGFKGGLSAGNYATIAGVAPATATRDLAELVERGVLIRTGQLRHTRYHLPVPLRPVPTICIDSKGQVVETMRPE